MTCFRMSSLCERGGGGEEEEEEEREKKKKKTHTRNQTEWKLKIEDFKVMSEYAGEKE